MLSTYEILGRVINRLDAEIFDLYHDRATSEFFRHIVEDEELIKMALRLYWRDVDHTTPPSAKQIMKIVCQLKLGEYPGVEPL